MSTYFSVPIKKNEEITKPKTILTPYQRHKQLMQHYTAPTTKQSIPKSDLQILKQHHRFLRADESDDTWESRLAQKYYDKLFKEYCLGNFSRYKTGQIGLRWRTKSECIEGKGQFLCGNLACDEVELRSWEVNFGYLEDGERKNALVKIRLCKDCSKKLNHKRKREKAVDSVSKRIKFNIDEEDGKKIENDSGINHYDKEEAEVTENETVNVWSKPIDEKELNEKSVEEEMDSFLADLLL